MKDVSYFSLFPKLVYSSFLDRSITKSEYEYINILAKDCRTNVSNFTSSNKQVLDHPAFLNVKKFITDNLNNYRDTVLFPKKEMNIFITESWVNYTNKNESHHVHTHTNSYLSGVFYFETIENDSIIFYKDWQPLTVQTDNNNLYNCGTWEYPVKQNQLILFPSNTQHSVKLNTQNKTRISLAFNTYIKGNLSIKPTTSLEL